MPNYKIVDADKLDSDLEAVADAIREKAPKIDKYAFPNGMAEAVRSIGSEDRFNLNTIAVGDETQVYLRGPSAGMETPYTKSFTEIQNEGVIEYSRADEFMDVVALKAGTAIFEAKVSNTDLGGHSVGVIKEIIVINVEGGGEEVEESHSYKENMTMLVGEESEVFASCPYDTPSIYSDNITEISNDGVISYSCNGSDCIYVTALKSGYAVLLLSYSSYNPDADESVPCTMYLVVTVEGGSSGGSDDGIIRNGDTVNIAVGETKVFCTELIINASIDNMDIGDDSVAFPRVDVGGDRIYLVIEGRSVGTNSIVILYSGQEYDEYEDSYLDISGDICITVNVTG